MRKSTFLMIWGFIPVFFWAQHFSLIGERYPQYQWSNSACIGVNQDEEGNILMILKESAQPRNPEIVRMNMSTLTIEELTMNDLPTQAFSTGEAIVKENSNIYLGMRSFDNRYFAYDILPDITLDPFGSDTGVVPNNNPGGGVDTAVEMDSNGAFYVAGGLEGSFISKYENGTWSFLPKFNDLTYEDPLIQFPDLGIDENDNLYVVFQERQGEVQGSPWRTKLKKLSPNSDAWETIHEETLGNEAPALLVVSSNEMYFSFQQLLDDSQFYFIIRKYDGNTVTQVGQPILFDYYNCLQADMIKLSSDGKLYFSNCDNMFVYNEEQNEWMMLENDIADGRFIASFNDKFYEMNDGTLLNIASVLDDTFTYEDFSLIRYTPEGLKTKDIKNNFQITAYPNPTNDEINISLNNEKLNTIEIFNTAGQLVNTFSPKSTNTYKLSMAQYPKGVYLIRINGGKTVKVIRQ